VTKRERESDDLRRWRRGADERDRKVRGEGRICQDSVRLFSLACRTYFAPIFRRLRRFDLIPLEAVSSYLLTG
jgi:hypothetical protein